MLVRVTSGRPGSLKGSEPFNCFNRQISATELAVTLRDSAFSETGFRPTATILRPDAWLVVSQPGKRLVELTVRP